MVERLNEECLSLLHNPTGGWIVWPRTERNTKSVYVVVASRRRPMTPTTRVVCHSQSRPMYDTTTSSGPVVDAVKVGRVASGVLRDLTPKGPEIRLS